MSTSTFPNGDRQMDVMVGVAKGGHFAGLFLSPGTEVFYCGHHPHRYRDIVNGRGKIDSFSWNTIYRCFEYNVRLEEIDGISCRPSIMCFSTREESLRLHGPVPPATAPASAPPSCFPVGTRVFYHWERPSDHRKIADRAKVAAAGKWNTALLCYEYDIIVEEIQGVRAPRPFKIASKVLASALSLDRTALHRQSLRAESKQTSTSTSHLPKHAIDPEPRSAANGILTNNKYRAFFEQDPAALRGCRVDILTSVFPGNPRFGRATVTRYQWYDKAHCLVFDGDKSKKERYLRLNEVSFHHLVDNDTRIAGYYKRHNAYLEHRKKFAELGITVYEAANGINLPQRRVKTRSTQLADIEMKDVAKPPQSVVAGSSLCESVCEAAEAAQSCALGAVSGLAGGLAHGVQTITSAAASKALASSASISEQPYRDQGREQNNGVGGEEKSAFVGSHVDEGEQTELVPPPSKQSDLDEERHSERADDDDNNDDKSSSATREVEIMFDATDVGKRIEIKNNRDKETWRSGVIEDFSELTHKHKIKYDDGFKGKKTKNWYNLENFEYELLPDQELDVKETENQDQQLDVNKPFAFAEADYRSMRLQREDAMVSPKFKVHISEENVKRIQRFTNEYQRLETGGDLFGEWNQDGSCTVTSITGPGKNAKRTGVTWNQSEEYMVAAGGYLKEKGQYHLGTWHSHHQIGLTVPSGGDSTTCANAIRNYNRRWFIAIVTTIETEYEKDYSDYDSYGRRPPAWHVDPFNRKASKVVKVRPYRYSREGGHDFEKGKLNIRETGWPDEFEKLEEIRHDNRTYYQPPPAQEAPPSALIKSDVSREPTVSDSAVVVVAKPWYCTPHFGGLLHQISECIKKHRKYARHEFTDVSCKGDHDTFTISFKTSCRFEGRKPRSFSLRFSPEFCRIPSGMLFSEDRSVPVEFIEFNDLKTSMLYEFRDQMEELETLCRGSLPPAVA